jgi:RNA polymerase sigma-70 factor (ECF subfamily)
MRLAAKMEWDKNKEDELRSLLDRFSTLIKVHIIKFNPLRFGLDPDDISQEIRIKIWRLLRNEKNIKNYASYIKKIVNSSVIDLLRKYKRDEAVVLSEKQKRVSEVKGTYPATIPLDEVLRDRVAEAVDSLIESRRNVVRLHLLDMTIEEISAFYGWSMNKTRNLLYRGLTDLKRALKNKDIDYEDNPG